MGHLIEKPEYSWIVAMQLYFQEVDYHGLGQILRKWNVRGTENQNGTWIDWEQVPELCQKMVKEYVCKVIESRKKQKEWEEYVRITNLTRGLEQKIDETIFEEKENKVLKVDSIHSGNWNRKNFPKRTNVDEIQSSQYVLNRVPYPLQVNKDDNMSRWKKIGNLNNFTLKNTDIRWMDEEYDPNIIIQERIWQQSEEEWWKQEKRDLNEERIKRAEQWIQKRQTFSTQSQKILRRFRDFIKQQNTYKNFLICPSSWTTLYKEEESQLEEDEEEKLEEEEEIEEVEVEDEINPWDKKNDLK